MENVLGSIEEGSEKVLKMNINERSVNNIKKDEYTIIYKFGNNLSMASKKEKRRIRKRSDQRTQI